MINTIKQLFGFGNKIDLAQLVREGAIILDVRSKPEYQSGHIKESINISVDTLGKNLERLKKDTAIITCCASGVRSVSAKSILLSNGFNEVHNGGSWNGFQNKIS